MPQMSPISWLNLFIFMFTLFLIFNTLNYYNYLSTPPKSQCNTNYKLINWKW